MKIFGQILNPKAAEKATLRIQKRMEQARKVALFQIAAKIHESAIKSINENGDGPVAQRYQPDRKVNVSKPGSTPNTDTGRLVQSIRMEFLNGGATALVGTNLKYGAYLEFGTRTMAPRPWLSKAFKDNTDDAAEIFSKLYGKEK